MKKFPIIFLITFTLSLADLVQAGAGDLDPSFGNAGKVIMNINPPSMALDMAIQPDGKIISGGVTATNPDFVLVRHDSNGTPDPTFGSAGKVQTDFGGLADTANDITLQPDGRIVVVGETGFPVTTNIALARYNSDGSLDLTFGNGGKVITDIPETTSELANAVAIQADGKIVIAGVSFATGHPNTDFLLVRYNPDGSLDPSFGSGGIVISLGGRYTDVLIQSNDKIVAAGLTPFPEDFMIARFNPNGSLDPFFGSGGIQITDFSGDTDAITAIALQPDDKIVAAGNTFNGSAIDFGLARYDSNGNLDSTFGTGGIVSTDFSNSVDSGLDVLVQSTGRIVVIGSTNSGGFGLAGYNSDGSLDFTFGNGGKVVTDFGLSGERATSGGLQSDGKIVAAGFAFGPVGALDFVLSRYETDSTPPGSCSLFHDEFEDAALAPDWNYVKPSWIESGGDIVGTPTGGKAEVIATPAFSGCGTGFCSVHTSILTEGGQFNKIFFFGWFQDKQNTIELLMKQESGKLVLRQRSGGAIVAKAKVSMIILPDVYYDVSITYNAGSFSLFINNILAIVLPAEVAPSGTVGYRVKRTTGKFRFICVS